jgi:hypothetical protein
MNKQGRYAIYTIMILIALLILFFTGPVAEAPIPDLPTVESMIVNVM